MRGPFPTSRAPFALLLLAACAPTSSRHEAGEPELDRTDEAALLALAAASWDAGLDDEVAEMGADWGSWSLLELAAEPRIVGVERRTARLVSLAWKTRFDDFRARAESKGWAELTVHVETWERDGATWTCSRRRRALRPDGIAPDGEAAEVAEATRAARTVLERCSEHWLAVERQTALPESAESFRRSHDFGIQHPEPGQPDELLRWSYHLLSPPGLVCRKATRRASS